MADGTRMNQMAENIVVLKKTVEKNEKVLEKIEKRLEQSDLQVRNQISEIRQDINMKFGEIMKNLAYLTQVAEKGKSSLETKHGEPLIVEANAGDSRDQMEESFNHLSHHNAHNNDEFAMIPEIESMELQWGHPVHEHADEHLDLSIDQIKKSRKEVQQAVDPGKKQFLLGFTKLGFLNKNQDVLVLDKLSNLNHHLFDESSQPSCKDLLEDEFVKKKLCCFQEWPLMEVNVIFFKHRWRWKLG
jgi:hypothetical protein